MIWSMKILSIMEGGDQRSEGSYSEIRRPQDITLNG